ncbi:hypothetical protein PEC18_30295 [Paucibacter sp. O1-1]|nr:hypothetical protein [Paucibacter sp. O1-1]MDA3830008.1 hypothetical protein [Paucibacter sp. O1-1]
MPASASAATCWKIRTPCPGAPNCTRRAGFRPAAAYPIRLKGQVRGTLSVSSADPWFFRDKEIALLGKAADDVSFALDNFERENERRAAEVIAEDERLFSETGDRQHAGRAVLLRQHGPVPALESQFRRRFRPATREIAGMHPLDFFADDDKPPLAARIAEVFERGDSYAELPLRGKDGTSTPYFFTGKRVEFSGTPCLVGMGIDISGRMRAEAARLASEARYRDAVPLRARRYPDCRSHQHLPRCQ